MAPASGRHAVILFALALGGLLFWMWRRGELMAVKTNDVLAAVAGLAGCYVFVKGEILTGILLLVVAALWFGARRSSGLLGRFNRPKPRPSGIAMTIDEASRVLDVPADADAAAIKAAHRRLVALVHPDHGGTAELAMRVNAARDTLLAYLKSRPR